MMQTLADATVVALVLLGAGFSLLAAIGLLRMPDLFMRMQSATKAGTLGLACTALAAGVHFGVAGVAMESLLVIVFAFATAPIASHLIGRAAWVAGVPLWRQTTRDDLSDHGHLGRAGSSPGSGQPPLRVSADVARRRVPRAERIASATAAGPVVHSRDPGSPSEPGAPPSPEPS